jgi:hypothetical protein
MKLSKIVKIARDVLKTKKCKSWIEYETKFRYEEWLINHLRIKAIYIEEWWKEVK